MLGADKLKILADYFGVSIEYFLEEQEVKKDEENMGFHRRPSVDTAFNIYYSIHSIFDSIRNYDWFQNRNAISRTDQKKSW